MENGLTEKEMDAVREVGDIGVGQASTALSRLLGKRIMITLPQTKFIRLEEFAQEIGGADRMVVAVYHTIQGDISAESMLMFPRDGAVQMIDILMGKQLGQTRVIEDMELSAFKEMSNIFTGAYLNALADMLGYRVMQSVPHVATDMAQAVLDFMLIKLAKRSDEMLCVKTAIDIEGHDINGQFIILFEEESQKKMASALHDKYGV